jgi:aryl-alcohol dehydrogenase-like predicted oxidoreductase
MEIQKRKPGKIGINVTILGLGGEGILRAFGYDNEACALINRALDPGINYFGSAFHAGLCTISPENDVLYD